MWSLGNTLTLLLRNADGGLGQRPSSDSVAVVLSQEQETILQSIANALGAGVGDRVALFGAEDLSPNTPSPILSYTVPVGKKFKVRTVRAWASVDAEFSVVANAAQIDGGRTTPASLTYSALLDPMIPVAAGQTLVVGATHLINGPARTFKAVIQGYLENV